MDKNTTHLVDLRVAQEELILHRQELEKCAAELKIANENLFIGEDEHVKRTAELNNDLENMMFTVSHKVRKSVANIIGISKLVCEEKDIDKNELREMLYIIIHSAESLNVSTEELSIFIHKNKRN